ncbi:hypothetical protein SH1V18_04380 [Vallitalea longa]|uniref:HAMP domain-containing protein n=1 Tax=Vallitalea longa TaxID=2936439 RepID=A0A9W5YAY6_9FIRM|nr:sensor histidine kinase [Vallitalea longa]GKX27958.1 hypothetical protein SH1V18_04380 [Vallitalea longa]
MYKKQSLKRVITVMVLFFTCLPFLFFGTYYNLTFSNTLNKNAENFLTTSMEIMKRDIERNFQFTNDTSMNFLADKILREYLKEYARSNNPYTRNQLRYEIERRLQSSLNFNSLWREKLINGIFIFVDRENYFSILRDIPTDDIVETNKELFGESENFDKQFTFSPPRNDLNTIYFIRAINDLEQFKPIGKIILSIDCRKLNEIDETFIQYNNIKTFTFSDDSTVYFHSDSLDIGKTIDEKIYANRNENNIFELKINDEVHYMRIAKINDYNLYTAIGIPKKEVMRDLMKTQRNYYITISIILLLSLILGTIISSNIIKPVSMITKASRRISDGNYKNKLPEFNYRELNQLSTVFNQMIEKLDFSINQVYKKQLLLQEAELKMLQSQINPHFLFNVLDTISWEAVMNGQNKIQEMLNSLAQLIRSNIDFSNREIITISEELNYINYYVHLQQTRFEDKLSITINIKDNEIEKLYIPKLSIQPFIDNAIVHGIEPKDSMGHIQVALYEKANNMICEITDDGVGFDTSVNNKSKNKTKHNHIGIINVKKRINLLYGEPYGIDIISEPDKGTKVVITLPIVKDGDEICLR